jgi:hypothetical protein
MHVKNSFYFSILHLIYCIMSFQFIIYYIIYVKNYDTFKISIYNLRGGHSDLYYLESNAQADG